jgi:hypothetical protein
MTGPDDAFLAPDDALRDVEADTGPDAAEVERAADTADLHVADNGADDGAGEGAGDAGRSDGAVDGG